MPTSPTQNMGLVLPTLNGDIGEWDDIINEALGNVIDEHDHSAGKGVRITPLGLDINADLSFGGHRALNTSAVQLTAVAAAAMAGINRSLWVNSADNELYWRNNAGTDIKFTTGGTLNISLLGGIGGDYTASGALFSFDDATDRFLAQQQGSPRPWAGLAIGNLDIYQQAASIVNRVRIQSPSALAASYALTLPTALPGSTQLLQLSAAGAIVASNTIANAVALGSTLTVAGAASFPGTVTGATTFTGAISLSTTLAVAGAATIGGNTTIGGTLGVTGLITANAGLTAAANQNINLQGAGKVNHAEKMLDVAYETLQFGATGTWSLTTPDFLTGQSLGTFSLAGGYGYIDVQGLKPGDRVTSIIVAFTSSGGNPPTIGGFRGTWNAGFLFSTTLGTNTPIAGIRYATLAVDTPRAIGTYSPGGGVPAMSERLRLRVTAGSNTTVIYGITLVYDSVDTPTELA